MGHYDQDKIRKLAANKLKKTLESPERRAKETAFAEAHASDSDEELYEYVLSLKCSAGDKLKAAEVIGYAYLTERLGSWPAIMTRVNELLREAVSNQKIES